MNGMATAEIGEQGIDVTDEDMAVLCDQRTAAYGFLSRMYRKELTRDMLDELHNLRYRVRTGNDDVDTGHRLLATYLSGLWENSITELAADYMRVFYGHGYNGHAAAYPFESVYTSEKRLLMQSARDEVLALYRAEGLDKQKSWKEGEDHIALELEFMEVLTQREADALRDSDADGALHLARTQLNFLEDHLLSWTPLMTAEMRKFAKTGFYQALAFLTDGFLQNDRDLLEDMLFD
ncbi:TorD/DmsD family molecular chaperone [Curtanaerobium respiraculi]|uniref:TorD/DmsD family molecular chaperone n=1 Tax=Curtanaerobium respiraculi TaxID=2949669 RepID=UPI0024B37AAD|nr:molecular chaperone TorD family protein [Curtanaerobium respiraculi]